MKKIGFIGCGNMGGAILKGILSANLVKENDIFVHTSTKAKMEQLASLYHIQVASSNVEVVMKSDIIFLAIKPYLFERIFEEIKDVIEPTKLFVSIAAGQSLSNMLVMSGRLDTKIIRTMPNTPVMVGEGMSAATPNINCNETDVLAIMNIFTSFGKCEIIDEQLMDAIPSVSGSSPAYVFMMINALCDGAVRDGMTRQQALVFASQAVLGSAKMVLESGIHPEQLKDMVCSAKGTTIEAVASLEKSGFRSSILEAMKACSDRLREMNK